MRGGGDPESLEGLLERGRGAGWAAAFAAPWRARDIVIACVLEDPRWDRQIERRTQYYAKLVLELGAPIDPIVAAARESDRSLARSVAEELAVRGAAIPDEASSRAAALGPVLGPFLPPSPPPPPIDTSARTDALLAEAVPGKILKLVKVIAQRRGARDREAVRRALVTGHEHARSVALRVLGVWGDPVGLAVLESTLDEVARGSASRRLVPACAQYLVGIGGEDAPSRARAWCARGYPWRVVADAVLEVHAQREDLELLDAEMTRALAEGELYRTRDLARALGRAGAPEGRGALERAWRETRYSFARAAILASTVALAGPDHPFVIEALWDCERGARMDACRRARGPIADARRRELADDPWEAPGVREVAADGAR